MGNCEGWLGLWTIFYAEDTQGFHSIDAKNRIEIRTGFRTSTIKLEKNLKLGADKEPMRLVEDHGFKSTTDYLHLLVVWLLILIQ